MSKKNLMIAILTLLLLTVAVLQFVPEAQGHNHPPQPVNPAS